MFASRLVRATIIGVGMLALIALIMMVTVMLSSVDTIGWQSDQLKPGCRHRMGCGVSTGANWADRREWSPMDGGNDGFSITPEASIGATTAPMMKSFPSPMMGGSVVGVDRQVSRTASLDLRAKSLDWTVDKVREIVKNVNGFVENSTVNQPEQGIRTAWMTVRVPADRFDVVLPEIRKAADQVTNENVGATDVTAQSIDLSARLRNKQAEEKAYENLLTNATKVSDIIDITSRLTQVRSEIESLQQQERYLEAQTTMVSITLSITEDPQVQGNIGEFERGNVFKAALNALVDALIALGSGLMVFLIAGLPILLIVFGLLWVVYRLAKRGVDHLFGR